MISSYSFMFPSGDSRYFTQRSRGLSITNSHYDIFLNLTPKSVITTGFLAKANIVRNLYYKMGHKK
jgi:hypothetical protein